MSIIGSTDQADGLQCVLVDHDPTSVATDVPKGSLIVDANGKMYRKMDDGATTNVRDVDQVCYADRGDPAAADFSIGAGLTADGAWNTLDLSSIVPVAAASKLVHLRCRILDNSVETLMMLRKLGNTNEINAKKAVTVVGGDSKYFDAWIMLDGDRKIEYNIEAAMGTAEITVAGWSA